MVENGSWLECQDMDRLEKVQNLGRMQTGKSIQEALVSCGIGDSDYKDVIQAMYLAAPKDPAAHAKNNYDQNGLHVPHTSIIRFFGKASIRIEDHGAVYAV